MIQFKMLYGKRDPVQVSHPTKDRNVPAGGMIISRIINFLEQVVLENYPQDRSEDDEDSICCYSRPQA